jgi:DNA-directed RNA polymerase specialized sigma24 family protein
MTPAEPGRQGNLALPLAKARRAADAIAQARAERDEWIVKAHAQGHSLRDIAAAANLDHSTVHAIIRKATIR